MKVNMVLVSLFVIPMVSCLASDDLPLSGTVIEVTPATESPIKLNLGDPDYGNQLKTTLKSTDGSCSFDVSLIGSSGRVEKGMCNGKKIDKGYVNVTFTLDHYGKPFLDKAYIYTWKN